MFLVLFPAWFPGYTRTLPGCVNGENTLMITGVVSPKACGIECTNFGASCKGFEYYNNHGGTLRKYQAQDCQFQSAVDTTDCVLAADFNLGFNAKS